MALPLVRLATCRAGTPGVDLPRSRPGRTSGCSGPGSLRRLPIVGSSKGPATRPAHDITQRIPAGGDDNLLEPVEQAVSVAVIADGLLPSISRAPSRDQSLPRIRSAIFLACGKARYRESGRRPKNKKPRLTPRSRHGRLYSPSPESLRTGSVSPQPRNLLSPSFLFCYLYS
jgi:hypothetical protein